MVGVATALSALSGSVSFLPVPSGLGMGIGLVLFAFVGEVGAFDVGDVVADGVFDDCSEVGVATEEAG